MITNSFVIPLDDGYETTVSVSNVVLSIIDSNGEQIERANRYIRFDVIALCNLAAKSCGAEKCIAIKKLDEGTCITLQNHDSPRNL